MPRTPLSPRLVVSVVVVALGFGACTSRGEPYVAAPTPTTAAPTDPASLLAADRAAQAEALVDELMACPKGEVAEGAPLPVAYVSATDASREVATELALPELGDEAAQLRALVDAANRCPGRDIELHLHVSYDLTDPVSLGRICDDVLRNERNAVVVSRGIPASWLRCVTDELPTLLIGAGDADQLAAGNLTLIGPDADAAARRAAEALISTGLLAADARVGVLHTAEQQALVDGAVTEAFDPAVAVELVFDRVRGCAGLNGAIDRFREADVDVIVSTLGPDCLPSAGLALRSSGPEWVILDLGVGTGDDATSSIAAIGSTLDGALAVTALPREPVRATVPSAPPALGEACNAITSAEGEDYQHGIVEYRAVEELCLAMLLVRDAAVLAGDDADGITARLRAREQLPLPDNLLGGFVDGRAAAVDDVVYIQRYTADCACWQLEQGPIALE